MEFAEIFAFEEFDLASTATISLVNMSNLDITSMITGPSDGTYNPSVTFNLDSSASSASIKINLAEKSDVTGVFISLD